MKRAIERPLRVSVRLVWLAAELFRAAALFVLEIAAHHGSPPLTARALWLQATSRRVLRIFNAELRSSGTIPQSGLLVSNHLSYLDILALSSQAPAIFVAKREVERWPVFGWFARLGGTLFADRERRSQAGALAASLQEALAQGGLVVLFPEGTSSDGRTVLPFKSALLESAASGSQPVCASSIEYALDDGDVGEEVCYWKDMTFLPHLLNLMSKRRIDISLRFSEFTPGSRSRKEVARQLQAEVFRLKFATDCLPAFGEA